MRKLLTALLCSSIFWSCNSDGKLDEGKLDKAGAKLQKTVEKGVDTIGSKLKKLKDKVDTEDSK